MECSHKDHQGTVMFPGIDNNANMKIPEKPLSISSIGPSSTHLCQEKKLFSHRVVGFNWARKLNEIRCALLRTEVDQATAANL